MKFKEFCLKMLEKIKSSKRIQFLLVLLLFAVIILVYCAYFVKGTGERERSNVSVSEESTVIYVASLEDKLENIVSAIDGVGRTSVAITVSSGFVYEYAYEQGGGSALSGKDSGLALVNGKPVVVAQEYPKIAGVLVVAEGSDNLRVKLDILEAVQTLLEVSNENITILN